ncbi:hypothetical protein L6164_013898 [Bauhinia variegata]|uniref:Uncharacterized protein n=1 Tax=Bauhinia variegata TaxID=167791 RepID=A0ACB9NFH7_BAUVA|nr:hypothetical protein L6164_013898 [Bauhinia variegata]
MESGSAPRRKVKFAPRAPPRRVPKPEVKAEVDEDADAVQAKDLLRRFNESAMKAKPKFEKKVASSQIAFGYGGESASIKSWGGSSSRQGHSFGAGVTEKEYKEPWDYYSYYPVTLPLRRPYSGNPELLDEEEFGEAAESSTYDENSINSAVELGLLEETPEPRMFLLQLPPHLPMIKGSDAAVGQSVTEGSKPAGEAQAAEKPCSLDQLPDGFMGKMLIYKSGKIKLKLGDTLYDVSSGLNCVFAQDVVAVNTAEKHCCVVGELGRHATVTPDTDAILESISNI